MKANQIIAATGMVNRALGATSRVAIKVTVKLDKRDSIVPKVALTYCMPTLVNTAAIPHDKAAKSAKPMPRFVGLPHPNL